MKQGQGQGFGVEGDEGGGALLCRQVSVRSCWVYVAAFSLSLAAAGDGQLSE